MRQRRLDGNAFIRSKQTSLETHSVQQSGLMARALKQSRLGVKMQNTPGILPVGYSCLEAQLLKALAAVKGECEGLPGI